MEPSPRYVILHMQIFPNLKNLTYWPCATCTVSHQPRKKPCLKTWAPGPPPLCSSPSGAHVFSLVLFSILSLRMGALQGLLSCRSMCCMDAGSISACSSVYPVFVLFFPPHTGESPGPCGIGAIVFHFLVDRFVSQLFLS